MPTLDWGQVTPESANLDENKFVYVYNHDLSSAEKVDRTIRFIIGRLNYYDKHLPPNPSHIIKIDARGQQINDSVSEEIKNKIFAKYSRPASVTIDIIK